MPYRAVFVGILPDIWLVVSQAVYRYERDSPTRSTFTFIDLSKV